MKTLEEILQILRQQKSGIQEKYSVTELGVFGSYARGSQTEQSDVDVLIDYQEPLSLLELIHLENSLSDYLGIKVDVVTKRGMKSRILERVLPEVIYV